MTLWKMIPNIMVDKLTDCFNSCLKKNVVFKKKERANLVLIPKENIDELGLPKVRPICLFDEVGKIFERVLAERILAWMRDNLQADLADNQFGFQKHRSTYDALIRMKELTSEAVREGDVAAAVSLDIANAFNSIPWKALRAALRRKDFP
ncbi:reverse [Lasius niger]|uniref:Reverse n=1 Tax=Lasius niger TaxID=67767 RepID=A0A0J7KJR9_LASNI|nr:reverse [Lasius niger]